jgi:hypothetical protein
MSDKSLLFNALLDSKSTQKEVFQKTAKDVMIPF